jgi:hypothetical protein
VLFFYSLRAAFKSLESVPSSGGEDYADLKTVLRKHVFELESLLQRSNDCGWMSPDSASGPKTALLPQFENRESKALPLLPASSVISIARTTLRTVERSSTLQPDSPALRKLREAITEIIVELEPAARKEPKFELRTGPDLYSRKAG